MLTENELSQFIATKLCHDLAGNIGAINNGIDFISSDSSDMRSKALELIKESAQQSVNKLIFFRNAYGVVKHNGEADLDEISKVAQDYIGTSKVSLDFHQKYFHIPGMYVSAQTGKLLLCLIQHAHGNLIYGGKIEVSISGTNGSKLIRILASGQDPKIDREKIDILSGNLNGYTPSTQNCMSLYAAQIAQKQNIKIGIDYSKPHSIEYLVSF